MKATDYEYLIIAGAPKAGTTSLYKYLAEHPDICPSSFKETRFFLDIEDILPSVTRYNGSNIEEYNSFFQNHDYKIRMEATPDYLYSTTAPKIKELLPKSKIIFILRDPIDRLISWFKFSKQQGLLEKNITFNEYIEMQFNIEFSTSLPPHLRALKQGQYDSFLENYREEFKDEMLIISFDEMKKEPKDTMNKICNFSKVDFDFYATYQFTIENKSNDVKFQSLEKNYIKMRTAIAIYCHKKPLLKKVLMIVNKYIKTALLLNKKPSSDLIISPETKEKLINYYKTDNTNDIK